MYSKLSCFDSDLIRLKSNNGAADTVAIFTQDRIITRILIKFQKEKNCTQSSATRIRIRIRLVESESKSNSFCDQSNVRRVANLSDIIN